MTNLTAEALVKPTPDDEFFTWECPDPDHRYPLHGFDANRAQVLAQAQAHLDQMHAS